MKKVTAFGLSALVVTGAFCFARALAADQPKPAPAPAKAAAPAAKDAVQTGTPATAATASADILAQRLAVLRRKVLREDDFVETDESNRDPFRSYLDNLD